MHSTGAIPEQHVTAATVDYNPTSYQEYDGTTLSVALPYIVVVLKNTSLVG